VALGAALAAQPDASLPDQTTNWNELRGAYQCHLPQVADLLAEDDVTHAALIAPHIAQIRRAAEEEIQSPHRVALFVQDTTSFDYTRNSRTAGLGRIGNTHARGFYAHSCLAMCVDGRLDGTEVSVAPPHLLGLAAQHVWTHPLPEAPPSSGSSNTKPKQAESRAQLRNRRNESDVWAETLEAIGPAPPPRAATSGASSGSEPQCSDSFWLSVSDRESDVFSFVRRARAIGWHVLTRVCQVSDFAAKSAGTE
jgi:hypothetical protein